MRSRFKSSNNILFLWCNNLWQKIFKRIILFSRESNKWQKIFKRIIPFSCGGNIWQKIFKRIILFFNVAAIYDKKSIWTNYPFFMWRQYMEKKIIKRAKLNKISLLVYDLKKNQTYFHSIYILKYFTSHVYSLDNLFWMHNFSIPMFSGKTGQRSLRSEQRPETWSADLRYARGDCRG